MKSFKGLIKRNGRDLDNAPANTPEGDTVRAIRAFCESGAMNNGDAEVLHLPVIVDSAESSPAAAASAAQQIRVFLSKEYITKPAVQYNAVMLLRILSDHPGPLFTKYFDDAFVSTVKKLLRTTSDANTLMILHETLDALQTREHDEGCKRMLNMWLKEKSTMLALHPRMLPSIYGYHGGGAVPPQQQPHQNARVARQLPNPVELASRVEEARNSAKILLQLLQSTPPAELVVHELIREFNDRCQAAQRSMQSYINCNAPPPDHDTMQTLIETNEQLGLATSRYQRAMLAARRALGSNASSAAPSPQPQQEQQQPLGGPTDSSNNVYSAFAPAPTSTTTQPTSTNAAGAPSSAFLPPPTNGTSESYRAPSGPPPNRHPGVYSTATDDEAPLANPFADPVPNPSDPAPFIEPAHYGWAPESDSNNKNTTASTSAFAPAPTSSATTTHHHHSRNASYLEDAYGEHRNPSISEPATANTEEAGGSSSFHPSPVLHSASPAVSAVSPMQSPTRRGVPELDAHSQVGRRDRDPPPPGSVPPTHATIVG